MKGKTTVKSVLYILIAFVMVLAGCSQSGGSSEISQGVQNSNEGAAKSEGNVEYEEELVFTGNQDATSLDPHNVTDNAAIKMSKLLYSTLVYKDTDSNELLPRLAESWTINSDTEWVFKLKDGVTFHDGSKMTASDVVFSLNRSINSATVGGYLSAVDSVSSTDDSTVVIKLKYPSASLLENLSVYASSILSENVINGIDGEYVAVGTGPYKLSEWVTNDHIKLERYDGYFGGVPKTRYLIYRPNKESTSAVIALENGEIDVYDGIIPNDYQKITDNPDLKLLTKTGSAAQYVGFNCAKAPFDNVLVRQAVVLGINREDILTAIRNGDGVVGNSLFAPGVTGSYDGMEGFSYDPKRAKELLNEAGYPDGFKTTLTTDAGGSSTIATQLIQSNLSEIGVEVEIIQNDSTALLEAMAAGTHEMFYTSWSPASLTAETAVSPFLSANVGGLNKARYSNAEVDELADRASKEQDETARFELYKQIQIILTNDCPWTVVYYLNSSIAARKDVLGITVDPCKLTDISGIYAPKR